MAQEKFTKAQALEQLEKTNATTGNILRIVGILLSFFSVMCILNPIAAGAGMVADCLENIPCMGECLGDLVEGIAGAVVAGISCLCGCGSALCVIAIVWVVMRPLYGIGMMVVVLCCCGAAVGVCKSVDKKPRKRKNQVEETEMQQPPMMDQSMYQQQPIMYQEQP